MNIGHDCSISAGRARILPRPRTARRMGRNPGPACRQRSLLHATAGAAPAAVMMASARAYSRFRRCPLTSLHSAFYAPPRRLASASLLCICEGRRDGRRIRPSPRFTAPLAPPLLLCCWPPLPVRDRKVRWAPPVFARRARRCWRQPCCSASLWHRLHGAAAARRARSWVPTPASRSPASCCCSRCSCSVSSPARFSSGRSGEAATEPYPGWVRGIGSFGNRFNGRLEE